MESITYVSPRYPPYIGGVETHVAELTTRASARFGRFSVVTTDPSGGLSPRQSLGNGLTVFRVRSFAPGENYNFPLSASLVKILRSCRSRILHLHSIHDVLDHSQPYSKARVAVPLFSRLTFMENSVLVL